MNEQNKCLENVYFLHWWMEVVLSSITNSTSLKINIFEIEELMRKLATIRTIANIKPIPNADRIEVAQVDGWEVIISKSDNFSQGGQGSLHRN